MPSLHNFIILNTNIYFLNVHQNFLSQLLFIKCKFVHHLTDWPQMGDAGAWKLKTITPFMYIYIYILLFLAPFGRGPSSAWLKWWWCHGTWERSSETFPVHCSEARFWLQSASFAASFAATNIISLGAARSTAKECFKI